MAKKATVAPVTPVANPLASLLNKRVDATILDGKYSVKLSEIVPKNTKYRDKDTGVEKEGLVFNFNWKLEDGRTLVDSRFTVDDPDDNVRYRSINIMLGNIASQLGLATITLQELLDLEKPVTIWVSRATSNNGNSYRAVEFYERKQATKVISVGNPNDVPF